MTDENKQTKFKLGDTVSFKHDGVLLIGKIGKIVDYNKTYCIDLPYDRYIKSESELTKIPDEQYKVGEKVKINFNNKLCDGTITSILPKNGLNQYYDCTVSKTGAIITVLHFQIIKIQDEEVNNEEFKVGEKVSFQFKAMPMTGIITDYDCGNFDLNTEELIYVDNTDNTNELYINLIIFAVETSMHYAVPHLQITKIQDEEFEMVEEEPKFNVGDKVTFLVGDGDNNIPIIGKITKINDIDYCIDIGDGASLSVPHDKIKHFKEPKFKTNDHIIIGTRRGLIISDPIDDTYRIKYANDNMVHEVDENSIKLYTIPFKVGDTIYRHNIPVIVNSISLNNWQWEISYGDGAWMRKIEHTNFLNIFKSQKQYDDKWKDCEFKYGDKVTTRFGDHLKINNYIKNLYWLDGCCVGHEEDDLTLYVESKFKIEDRCTTLTNDIIIIKNIIDDYYIGDDYKQYRKDDLKLHVLPIKVGDNLYCQIESIHHYVKRTITEINIVNSGCIKLRYNYSLYTNSNNPSKDCNTRSFTSFDEILTVHLTENQFNQLIARGDDASVVCLTKYKSGSTILKINKDTFILDPDGTDLVLEDGKYKYKKIN
jgi:hypothetical protein